MVDAEKRKCLSEESPDAVIFDNPSFDKSIVGISSEGHVCYDYEHMLLEYMEDTNSSYEEACNFIDYAVLGSLDSIAAGGLAPVIIVTDADWTH